MLLQLNKQDRTIEFKKPVIAAVIFVAVFIIGTFGYHIIWSDIDASFVDELFMTYISISTIGYDEVYPLDTAGRIFTIIISTLGIGSLFYLLGVVMENLVIMQVLNIRGRKKTLRKIKNMEDHIIIVGYGRVGKLAVEEIKYSKEKFIIVDKDFAAQKEALQKTDFIAVEGDATSDDVLKQAGVERAKSLVVTTANSATTVFVVLSAKVLNKDLFVVARSDDEELDEKLKIAGADRIVNPYSIGGQRLANIALNPQMIDFIDSNFKAGTENLILEKLELPGKSTMADKSLIDLDIRRKSGATILAVIRDEKSTLNPHGDHVLKDKDQIVAVGTRKQLNNLEKMIFETK